MRILVIDNDADLRRTLVARLGEAYRQAGLRRVVIEESTLAMLGAEMHKGPPELAFLGPGCYGDLQESITRFRSIYPSPPLAVVLANDVYAAAAVDLRRSISARIMPLADIAQMAQFILDADVPAAGKAASKHSGVINVVHLKGGVGATSVAAALASCWARHGLSVVLVDLDDINPQLTEWGEVGPAERRLAGELLRAGEVPSYRLDELLQSVRSYNERLSVCGQPETYGESFHFKADVINGAPSSADYIESLLAALREAFDIVVIDSGRSWGISTFASLPYSQKVLLVTDDDPRSLKRTLSNFQRLCRESDDPAEFDLGKWSIVLNAYTGAFITMEEAAAEIADLELFPESVDLLSIPFCDQGRLWGEPGESFYDLAEPSVQEALRQIAFHLVPFRYQPAAEDLVGKLRRGIRTLVGA